MIIKLSDTLLAVYSNGPTSHSLLKSFAVCQMPHKTAQPLGMQSRIRMEQVGLLTAPSL